MNRHGSQAREVIAEAGSRKTADVLCRVAAQSGPSFRDRRALEALMALEDPCHDSSHCYISKGRFEFTEVERISRAKHESLSPLLAALVLDPEHLLRATHLDTEEAEQIAPLIRSISIVDQQKPHEALERLVNQYRGSLEKIGLIDGELQERFAQLHTRIRNGKVTRNF